MTNNKKILITGSSGYLGNFLAVYFGNKGVPVVGTDLKPHQVIKDIPNFTFYSCDIRDREKLKEIFQKEKPTHVIHLAYLMDPIHDKQAEYDIDVKGSKYALEIANETESVKQFVLFSSASIYGAHPDNPEYMYEDSLLRPADYNYAKYKKEVEEYYHQFSKRNDMKLVIFRMCTAVGPSYYKSGGVVSSFSKAPFNLQIGFRKNAAQFIHEDDVKALVEKLINDESVEDTFNLGPDSYSFTGDLAEALGKKTYRIPYILLRIIFWFLWNLRIAAMTPAMARLMAYPIAAHPKKLMEKYGYKFKYSTKEAFLDAVEKRKVNETL